MSMQGARAAAIMLAALLSACTDPPRGSVPGSVSVTGQSLVARADMPLDPLTGNDSGTVMLSTVVYLDAVPQLMVGGDYVRARAGTQSTRMTADSGAPGAYAGRLDGIAAGTGITIDVDYDPLSTTAGRWFTGPSLVNDPGAGTFVGTQALITLPAAVAITAPAQSTGYRDLDNDIIEVTWTPPENDPLNRLRLGWHHTCPGFSTLYDGGLIDLPAESLSSGSYELPLADILVQPTVEEVVLGLIVDVYVSSLHAATFGLLMPGYDGPDETPTIGTCDIYLTLYHEHVDPALLPEGFNGGEIIGSRSDTVQLRYVPLP